MADHYARTFTAAGATTLTLDGMPFGAGRLIVSKVGGDNGDLWLSVGNATAAVGANNCVVIPDGKSDEMVWINGLLQRSPASCYVSGLVVHCRLHRPNPR